jgi:hypothetical protein
MISKDGLPWLAYLSLDFFKFFESFFSFKLDNARIYRREIKVHKQAQSQTSTSPHHIK